MRFSCHGTFKDAHSNVKNNNRCIQPYCSSYCATYLWLQVQHRAQPVQSLLLPRGLHGGPEQPVLSALRRVPHVRSAQCRGGVERRRPQTGNTHLLFLGPFSVFQSKLEMNQFCADAEWLWFCLSVFPRLWFMRRRDCWDTFTVISFTAQINLTR